MSVARFPVTGSFDSAGGRHHRGTVTIDRGNNMFCVRPLRRKKTFSMPLGVVADMVCRAIILSEMREKKAAKKAKKAGR